MTDPDLQLELTKVAPLPSSTRGLFHSLHLRLAGGNAPSPQAPSGLLSCLSGPSSQQSSNWHLLLRNYQETAATLATIEVKPKRGLSRLVGGIDLVEVVQDAVRDNSQDHLGFATVPVNPTVAAPSRQWLHSRQLRAPAWTLHQDRLPAAQRRVHMTFAEYGPALNATCGVWSDDDPGVLLLSWPALSHAPGDPVYPGVQPWLAVHFTDSLSQASILHQHSQRPSFRGGKQDLSAGGSEGGSSGRRNSGGLSRLSGSSMTSSAKKPHIKTVLLAAGEAGLLAVGLSDTAGHIAVTVVDGNHHLIMHRLLSSPISGNVKRAVRSVVWLPYSCVVCVMDNFGYMTMVDLSNRLLALQLIKRDPKRGTISNGSVRFELSFRRLLYDQTSAKDRKKRTKSLGESAFSMCALRSPRDADPRWASRDELEAYQAAIACTDGHFVLLLKCTVPETDQQQRAGSSRNNRHSVTDTGVQAEPLPTPTHPLQLASAATQHQQPLPGLENAANGRHSRPSDSRRPNLTVVVPDGELGPETSRVSAAQSVEPGMVELPAMTPSGGGSVVGRSSLDQSPTPVSQHQHAQLASTAMALSLPAMAGGSALHALKTHTGIPSNATPADLQSALPNMPRITWNTAASLPPAPASVPDPLSWLGSGRTLARTASGARDAGLVTPHMGVYLLPASVVNRLVAGDREMLAGNLATSLAYYLDAHIHGFLPCLLVLHRMAIIEGATELFTAFCSFMSDHQYCDDHFLAVPRDRVPRTARRVPLAKLNTMWHAIATRILTTHVPYMPTSLSPVAADGPHGHVHSEATMDGAGGVLHAAWQQLALACQCMAIISCSLHVYIKDHQSALPSHHSGSWQPGSARAGGLSSRASMTSPTRLQSQGMYRPPDVRHRDAPAFLVGFPLPSVWQPIQLPTRPDSYDGSQPASVSHTPRADTAPTTTTTPQYTGIVPCHLQLCHTAFDVSLLVEPRWHSVMTDLMAKHYDSRPPASSQSLSSFKHSAQEMMLAAAAQARTANTQTAVGRLLKVVHQPGHSAGLLLMSHACDHHIRQATGSSDAGAGQLGTNCIQWQLLMSCPAVGWAPSLWQVVGEWRKAAVLALSIHHVLDGSAAGATNLGRTPLSYLFTAASTSGGGAADPAPRPPIVSTAGTSEISPVDYDDDQEHGGASKVVSKVPSVEQEACAALGWRTLVQQLGPSLGSQELSGVCAALSELVAIPRHVMGADSPLYLNLLLEVSDRLLSIMPKRLCIMPLLPTTTPCVGNLLYVDPNTIQRHLQAHLGNAMAQVYVEACMAHDWGNAGSTPADQVVAGLLTSPGSQACLKLLLIWEGLYDVDKVAKAVEEACALVQDYQLCGPEDWHLDTFIPMLDAALTATQLMSADNRQAVLCQVVHTVQVYSGGPGEGGDGDTRERLPSLQAWFNSTNKTSSMASQAGSVSGGRSWEQQTQAAANGQVDLPITTDQLVNLHDLATLVDMVQLTYTMLSSIQPHGAPAVEALTRLHASGARDGITARQDAGLTTHASVTSTAVDRPTPGSLKTPADLTASLQHQLDVLMDLDWALVCRAHIITLLSWIRAHGGVVDRGSAGRGPSSASAPAGPIAASVECLLLQWLTALLHTASIHSNTELQTCALTVMSAAGNPSVSATTIAGLEQALLQRGIFNSKLAEQLRRLKGLARQGPSRGGSFSAAQSALKVRIAPGIDIWDPTAAKQQLSEHTLQALQACTMPEHAAAFEEEAAEREKAGVLLPLACTISWLVCTLGMVRAPPTGFFQPTKLGLKIVQSDLTKCFTLPFHDFDASLLSPASSIRTNPPSVEPSPTKPAILMQNPVQALRWLLNVRFWPLLMRGRSSTDGSEDAAFMEDAWRPVDQPGYVSATTTTTASGATTAATAHVTLKPGSVSNKADDNLGQPVQLLPNAHYSLPESQVTAASKTGVAGSETSTASAGGAGAAVMAGAAAGSGLAVAAGAAGAGAGSIKSGPSSLSVENGIQYSGWQQGMQQLNGLASSSYDQDVPNGPDGFTNVPVSPSGTADLTSVVMVHGTPMVLVNGQLVPASPGTAAAALANSSGAAAAGKAGGVGDGGAADSGLKADSVVLEHGSPMVVQGSELIPLPAMSLAPLRTGNPGAGLDSEADSPVHSASPVRMPKPLDDGDDTDALSSPTGSVYGAHVLATPLPLPPLRVNTMYTPDGGVDVRAGPHTSSQVSQYTPVHTHQRPSRLMSSSANSPHGTPRTHASSGISDFLRDADEPAVVSLPGSPLSSGHPSERLHDSGSLAGQLPADLPTGGSAAFRRRRPKRSSSVAGSPLGRSSAHFQMWYTNELAMDDSSRDASNEVLRRVGGSGSMGGSPRVGRPASDDGGTPSRSRYGMMEDDVLQSFLRTPGSPGRKPAAGNPTWGQPGGGPPSSTKESASISTCQPYSPTAANNPLRRLHSGSMSMSSAQTGRWSEQRTGAQGSAQFGPQASLQPLISLEEAASMAARYRQDGGSVGGRLHSSEPGYPAPPQQYNQPPVLSAQQYNQPPVLAAQQYVPGKAGSVGQAQLVQPLSGYDGARTGSESQHSMASKTHAWQQQPPQPSSQMLGVPGVVPPAAASYSGSAAAAPDGGGGAGGEKQYHLSFIGGVPQLHALDDKRPPSHSRPPVAVQQQPQQAVQQPQQAVQQQQSQQQQQWQQQGAHRPTHADSWQQAQQEMAYTPVQTDSWQQQQQQEEDKTRDESDHMHYHPTSLQQPYQPASYGRPPPSLHEQQQQQAAYQPAHLPQTYVPPPPVLTHKQQVQAGSAAGQPPAWHTSLDDQELPPSPFSAAPHTTFTLQQPTAQPAAPGSHAGPAPGSMPGPASSTPLPFEDNEEDLYPGEFVWGIGGPLHDPVIAIRRQKNKAGGGGVRPDGRPATAHSNAFAGPMSTTDSLTSPGRTQGPPLKVHPPWWGHTVTVRI